MSVGEGGRLSASSSGLGSIGSYDSQRQNSGQPIILSGIELYRENFTAWKPCDETCGYCQLECPNCSSYASLSVQRIDGKIQQVWTIVNKSFATISSNPTHPNSSGIHNEERLQTENHTNSQTTYTSLGNVSTLCSRRALHLTPCKDCVEHNATAPPLSRPHSSDSGLFDLSEGKPVRYDGRLGFETIAKYKCTLSQARTKNKASPSNQSTMSDAGKGSHDVAEEPADEAASSHTSNEENPSSEHDQAPSLESETQESNLNMVSGVPDDDRNSENSGVQLSEASKVTNPFEEGYEDPVVHVQSKSSKEGANPFEEDNDDNDTNPFNTDSPAISSNSRSSGKKDKPASPSTRPSSSILDVRKLIHPDKVHPMELDSQNKNVTSEVMNNNSLYDPEAICRQPSIVSSTGPTVFSKTALFLKQMLVGAAVIILIGVTVMFLASLGKSMMT